MLIKKGASMRREILAVMLCIVALAPMAACASEQPAKSATACDQLKTVDVAGPMSRAMTDQADDAVYAEIAKGAGALHRAAAGAKDPLKAALVAAATAADGVADKTVTDDDMKAVDAAFTNLGKEVDVACPTG